MGQGPEELRSLGPFSLLPEALWGVGTEPHASG